MKITNKNKYQNVEDFFREPLTFRQKLMMIKHQIWHEILTAWKFWKKGNYWKGER